MNHESVSVISVSTVATLSPVDSIINGHNEGGAFDVDFNKNTDMSPLTPSDSSKCSDSGFLTLNGSLSSPIMNATLDLDGELTEISDITTLSSEIGTFEDTLDCDSDLIENLNLKPGSIDKEDEDGVDDGLKTIRKESSGDKPGLSYIALISKAIQSCPAKRMLLCEIYHWIVDKYPFYQLQDRSWRNSIRHNLSLNECFIKAGRSENGKGNYWSIHPANVEDFFKGDFRRRRARRRVRMSDDALRGLQRNAKNSMMTANNYIPMTCTWASAGVLARVFGDHAIYTPEELLQHKRRSITMPSHCYYGNQHAEQYPSYFQGQWGYNQGKSSVPNSSFDDCMFGDSTLLTAAAAGTTTTADNHLFPWQ